jgi:RNA-dependent RNA polymerase
LDITTTSARPIPMFLNRPLITLLEHLGVPYSSFLDLQKQALDASKQIQTSFIHASNAFEQHGLGQSFRLTSLLRNIQELLHLDRTRGSHSRAVLRYGTIDKICELGSIHIMRDIKHRARIFIPGSFTLIGLSSLERH